MCRCVWVSENITDSLSHDKTQSWSRYVNLWVFIERIIFRLNLSIVSVGFTWVYKAII